MAFAVESGNLFLYIIPMMIIIPLSVRISYYRRAIVRLAAYIIVYHEKQIEELNWESRNFTLSQTNIFDKSIFTGLFEHDCLILSFSFLQALFTTSSEFCKKLALTILALVVVTIQFFISFSVESTSKERNKWIDIWTIHKLQNSKNKVSS